MSDQDPPLYAALRSLYGPQPPRHELREDRRVSTHESFGTGRYGADDDPVGPPSPPLDPTPPRDPDEAPAERTVAGHSWPFGWADISQQVDPAMTALSGDRTWAALTTELVACPSCGTGVHPDRIRD